jgi:hypothetical protein
MIERVMKEKIITSLIGGNIFRRCNVSDGGGEEEEEVYSK